MLRLLYGELRSLARAMMWRERPNHTLQATALVHEAYLRLVGATQLDWNDRAHFFRLAARAMRRVLVDHARRLRAGKRDSGQPITLEETHLIEPRRDLDILALDGALETLRSVDPRQVLVVELHFFAGMTLEEVAENLEISHSTARRDWRTARAWLRSQLG